MHTSTGLTDFRRVRPIHEPYAVRKGTRRIDDALGSRHPRFPRQTISHSSAGHASSRRVLDQFRHLDVIRRRRAFASRRQRESDVHSRVVVLAVVVDDRADELRLFQHGKRFESVTFAEEIAASKEVASGEEVVHLDADVEVRQLPPSVE